MLGSIVPMVVVGFRANTRGTSMGVVKTTCVGKDESKYLVDPPMLIEGAQATYVTKKMIMIARRFKHDDGTNDDVRDKHV